ncbi:hypothetical protein [Lysinibacillus sp. NPDC096212]|uniref:hypothetical protein n=1 Tax=Lysinibacillus sp. NPDC096212 TaxID=3364135 RepID=UPI003800020E
MTEKSANTTSRKTVAKKKKVTFITNTKYGENLYRVGEDLEVLETEFTELQEAHVIRESE